MSLDGRSDGEGVILEGPFGDQGPQGRIGGEDAVVAVVVEAGRREDRGQPPLAHDLLRSLSTHQVTRRSRMAFNSFSEIPCSSAMECSFSNLEIYTMAIYTVFPTPPRIWLNDGSCIRPRPLYRHHVWSFGFVVDRTHDGRPLSMLTVLDEYSRECLAIVVASRLKADDVLETLTEFFTRLGPPTHIRSDNGSEFTAQAVRDWLRDLGVKTLFIEPGSPSEDGYNESFNGTLGEEVAKREIFFTLREA